jgi:formaldehyde-activating enzyme
VTDDDIDGRIGEAWSGTAPNGSHVNVVLARRASPTAAAAVSAFASPTPGHAPVLVCLGGGAPVWPPTIMMNKATATEVAHQRVTWGAAQLGIGEGVIDAVAEGLLVADGETLLLVAVWVDPAAHDHTAVRAANRRATRDAIARARSGPVAGEVEALLALRGSVSNEFYDGE